MGDDKTKLTQPVTDADMLREHRDREMLIGGGMGNAGWQRKCPRLRMGWEEGETTGVMGTGIPVLWLSGMKDRRDSRDVNPASRPSSLTDPIVSDIVHGTRTSSAALALECEEEVLTEMDSLQHRGR